MGCMRGIDFECSSMDSADQNDAIRFLGGPMTENEFWKESKPKCCRPCTSNAFDHALEAKEEWGVGVGYTLI
jgi:hypothetical protein